MGTPLFRLKSGKLTIYHPKYHKGIVMFSEKCIAVKKLDVLIFIKGPLGEVVHSGGQYPSLIIPCMVKYIYSNNKKPVGVYWNSSTNMKQINRLKLPYIKKYLDMTTVENKGNNSYELVLKDMSEGKRVIFTAFIGVFHKPKRETLNLREYHSLVCQTVHNDVLFL